MKAVGRSDRGKIRESNQDQFIILREEKFLFGIVCDGIGGHVGGGKASNIVISYIKKHFKQHPAFDDVDKIQSYLKQFIKDTNKHLYNYSLDNPELKGMGTTLVGLLITPMASILVNVGDSRAYGLTNNSLELLSEDHSYINELIKLGKINKKQAKVHPYRNMLTNALGIAQDVLVDVSLIQESYQSYLLCSDGLHGYVEHDDMEATCLSNESPTKKVQSLIQQANAIGGFDNVTIVYVVGESL
jgi:serine/threonine protein phosphatase PrpC